MQGDVVQLKDVRFTYPGERFKTLSITGFRVKAGQRVALIGASGAGKSTLLRLLDGRLRDWSGTCAVLGKRLNPDNIPPRKWRRRVGFIFQEFALVQRETVQHNVLHGRLGYVGAFKSLFGRFGQDDLCAANRAMQEVGLAGFADKRVDQLSGGQRQRVAIARCLAQEPQLILADEPISNLDPQTAHLILRLLNLRATERGATLILTSHQPALVAEYVDKIVTLDHGRFIPSSQPNSPPIVGGNDYRHNMGDRSLRLLV